MKKYKSLLIILSISLIIFYFLPIYRVYHSTAPDLPRDYNDWSYFLYLKIALTRLFSVNDFGDFIYFSCLSIFYLIPLLVPFIIIILTSFNKRIFVISIISSIIYMIASIILHFSWFYLIVFFIFMIISIIDLLMIRKNKKLD